MDAVADATDGFLASLCDQALEQKSTVKPAGEVPVRNAVGTMCLTQGSTHLGEAQNLRCLPRLRGSRSSPLGNLAPPGGGVGVGGGGVRRLTAYRALLVLPDASRRPLDLKLGPWSALAGQRALACHFQGRLALPPRTASSNGRRCPARCRSDGKSTCPSLRVSSTIRAQSAGAVLPSKAPAATDGLPLSGCLGQRLAYLHLTAGVRHLSEREQLAREKLTIQRTSLLYVKKYIERAARIL